MEVSAKHEGQTLTFFLVGELDHHGAKGLLENLELYIARPRPRARGRLIIRILIRIGKKK